MDPVLLESLPFGGLELAIAAVGAAVTSFLFWARRRSATVPDDADTHAVVIGARGVDGVVHDLQLTQPPDEHQG